MSLPSVTTTRSTPLAAQVRACPASDMLATRIPTTIHVTVLFLLLILAQTKKNKETQ